MAIAEIAVPGTAQALRPLSPVQGRKVRDGDGGMMILWTRRSRLDTGWRDLVDLPLGENRELYRISPTPAVAGARPWARSEASLPPAAATPAALPPGPAPPTRPPGAIPLVPPPVVPSPS